MADLNLKDFLKNWFRAYHFSMMTPAVRAQWLDLMGKDDFDTVTVDTQETFRELTDAVTPVSPPAYNKDITIHLGNINQIRAISGVSDFDSRYKIGDKYKYNIHDAASRDTYLRIFSQKLGDRFYYNDVRSGGQKTWENKKTGNFLDSPFPDISNLSDPEIKRFYTIARTTLRNINDNPPEFSVPDSPPKVANFLGAGKAFEEFSIQSGGNADVKLKTFAKEAFGDPIFMETLRNHLSSRFGAEYTIDAFIADLLEPKIRARALNRVPTLMAILKEWNSTYSTIDPSIRTKVISVFGNSEKIDEIITETDQENEEINEIKLAQFKNPRVYKELLGAMYDTTKEGKKSAFFKEFAANGGTDVTKPMELIVDNYNYDKLDGKFKDNLTFTQQFKKDLEDRFDDHIAKLWKRNLRHNYVELNAKGVVDAICKLEINPESGLKGILAKKAEIKKILAQKSSDSEKGFDFLVEVLEKIQLPMKKAFAGALKNGHQAEAIAKEIIKAAIAHQPPKMAEARVALETLGVMRYDVLSSARGKNISKAIMGANFLDGTSFMKTDSVKFVINAAQKSFNLGLNGAFWLGVLVRNLIQGARGKISEKDIEALTTAMAKTQANADKFATFESAQTDLQEAKARYAEFEQKFDTAITMAGFPSSDSERLKKYVDWLETELAKSEEKHNDAENELKLNNPADCAKYSKFKKGAMDWIAAPADAKPDITEEMSDEINLWYSQLSPLERGIGQLETLMPKFQKYCTDKANVTLFTPAEIKNKELVIKSQKDSIENQQKYIDSIKPQYIQHRAELNVSQDVFKHQEKKHLERSESRTEHNPNDAPLNEKQNAQSLSWFWNACNGYDFGLDINDYNFLKKHKNQSQKLQFNASVNARFENAA